MIPKKIEACTLFQDNRYCTIKFTQQQLLVITE